MNAKRIVIASLSLFLFPLCAVFAQANAASWEDFLRTQGITVVARDTRSERVLYTMRGPSGEFTIDASPSISLEVARSLISLLDAVSGWKTMVPASLSFSVNGDDVRLRVVPASFKEGSRDFASFVPSGLVFSATGAGVDYEFRVKVESFFMRFQGRFSGERALIDRLISAIENPEEFIRNNDPDYLMWRVVELDSALAATNARIAELEAALAAATERIEAQTEAQIAMLEKKESLNAAATASALSKGVFGAPKPVDPAAIARILELKDATPGATSADLLATLKSEGIALTDKQIKAVLAVFFGEY